MHETPEDLAQLQALLDRSFESAGSHLAVLFKPSDRLAAESLIERLPGTIEVHLAVTTADGAPLVAPVDAQLFHGRLWFGLPPASVRTRLVRRDPRVSASYADGSFALIVHGVAHAVEPDSEEAAAYTDFMVGCYVAQYGEWWRDWFAGEQAKLPSGADRGFTGWIEPRRLYAKA